MNDPRNAIIFAIAGVLLAFFGFLLIDFWMPVGLMFNVMNGTIGGGAIPLRAVLGLSAIMIGWAVYLWARNSN